MSSRAYAIEVLKQKGSVVLTCNGSSMRPMIAPKEAIHIRAVDHKLFRVGDAVFVRINSNLQVHMVSAIDKAAGRYQISNRRGFVNGWVNANAIFGLAVKVEDRVLVSDEELMKRAAE